MSEIRRMPVIIVRDIVLMPKMTANFTIIKTDTAKACEDAIKGDKLVFLLTQKVPFSGTPTEENFHEIGSVAVIKQIDRVSGQSFQLIITSLGRGRLVELSDNMAVMAAVELLDTPVIENRIEREAMLRNIRQAFAMYCDFNINVKKSVPNNLNEIDNVSLLIDQITGNIPLSSDLKIEFLQCLDPYAKYHKLMRVLSDEVEVAKVRAELKKSTTDRINERQREIILKEQLETIKKELGDDVLSEEEELKASLEKLEASDEVKEKISKEISRLGKLNQGSTEASVQLGYIETLLDLPWDRMSEDNNDIANARYILERDHYGLEKVKERVLEFLAVRSLNSKGESPIICLVGPPGTGKTSIAKSIAEALNKKYVRVCLGGVRDEAEIRGHRRTYVGSMPGNIVAGIRQAGVKNPLILLDEIDKASGDHKGDTSSALLEVLDSEQNSHFKDHYVGIPVDLSEVLFIATANSASDIPRPLYDRMEVIEVSSYTANEKFHIAKEHLLKKEYAKNGLLSKQIHINDAAIKKIIQSYTKEAGVRELERKIGQICRKAAMDILENGTSRVNVSAKNLSDFLGKEKYREDQKNKKDEVGIVRGLAWTSVGGTTLSIEVNIMPGKGAIDLTGQMGDVMKESAAAGISYLRSIAKDYGIEPSFFRENDIHIHIPEGAVPKDGPSAGISMATAVLSALTKKPVSRNLAMTGEITLRGRVLAVGGLKEKILAAKTAGINKVLVPLENEADIAEIPEEIKDGMNIIFVSHMSEVVKEVFGK